MISRVVRGLVAKSRLTLGVQNLGRSGLIRGFSSSRTEHLRQDEMADVFIKPFGSPYIILPIPPHGVKTKIILTPILTMDILGKMIVFNMPKAEVIIKDLATGKDIDPKMLVSDFLENPNPQTIVFILNEHNRVYFKTPASSPSNNYLKLHFDMKNIDTIRWYQECMDKDIPMDQASLLSMYLRNVEALLKKSGKKSFTQRELLQYLKAGNQTLIEPTFTELNNFSHEISDRELTLKLLEQEKQQILGKSEEWSFFYIYVLLGISIFQFAFFYYTIFHVDWLGWDIMEPLTYTVEIINVLVAMRFYYKYRSVRGLDQIIRNSRERYINKHPAMKFRFTKLNANINELQTEKSYLAKSVNYYKNRQKMF